MKVKKIKFRGLKIAGAVLLTPEEAEKYLSKEERIYYKDWWLNSTNNYKGGEPFNAAVSGNGEIEYDCDDSVYYLQVRPALRFESLDNSNFKVGDTFWLMGYEFKIISESLAWMHKQDIGFSLYDEDCATDYEGSDIKKYVDNWYKHFTR